MSSAVTDNAAAGRFELALEGGVAFISYRRRGEVLLLTHAEVPAALEGKGIGSRLARETLELIRARGQHMEPRCSFVRSYVERHPEYADLVAGPT